MKPKKRLFKYRFWVSVLSLILALTFVGTLNVSAKNDQKIIRVGWYESPFNIMDELGRRSGYAYEYQQKIASYTGWKYEYVEGSWPDLLEMLKEGKIDLMSDVSYSKERDKEMLFSSLPMGAEEYYLFTTPNNSDISSDDFSTFNGKKIGANKGSIQIEYYKEWAKTNNVKAQLVELSGTENNNIAALVRGDIDMYLTLDSVADKDATIPVCEIASSDFYFAVSNSRPDVLSELNFAMGRIRDDSPFYNQQMCSKYLKTSNLSNILNNHELDWLSKHGTIRIGYQDNYLAFCAKDPKTGKLTGALKDYIDELSKSMQNAEPKFEPVAYPTAQSALDAMEKGEIDCMFPVNLTDYYGESKGYSITNPLMNTDMSVIVSESNQDSFFNKERVTVAVNAGNPNYDMFLLDHFPEWRSIYFENTPECLKAIYQGKADCILMSSFRVNDISEYCEKYNLVPLGSGVKLDYCIGVKRSNTTLYAILNKMINAVPETTMSIALSRYSTEEANSSFFEFLQGTPALVVGIIAIILLVILILILYSSKTRKSEKASKKLISATEIDDLTGLYIKNYFFEYANKIYKKTPETPMDAIVLNIIRFHAVNASRGRMFGDHVLHVMGEEILAFIKENGGIAGHTESDQFVIYCPHLNDCHMLFDRLQSKMDSISEGTNIKLRMGVMPWRKDTEPQQLVEHALIACNLARGLYKEHLIVFDENMRQMEEYEQQLLNDINSAVDNHDLMVYFQPKYNIQEDPPQLCGAEALVRWNHPKFGVIGSSDFIPLFERSGQIGIIDNYVWRETAKQAAKWKEKYGFNLPISINLSRLDIFDPMLENALEDLLKENNLDHDALELEVTESAYTENSDKLIEIIESLRQKGFKIQMDDFGSGYSSLNMLSSMPIDALKMDKAFITDINFNNKRIQLIELIMDIAEDLNIPVIAEGVENEEQLNLLQDLGCLIAQGFYFSKPISVEKFEKRFLENN